MEGIIKVITCDPVKTSVSGSLLEITADIMIDVDVNAMYKECVKAGFNPSRVTVHAHGGDTTLAALKRAGVSCVLIDIGVTIAERILG